MDNVPLNDPERSSAPQHCGATAGVNGSQCGVVNVRKANPTMAGFMVDRSSDAIGIQSIASLTLDRSKGLGRRPSRLRAPSNQQKDSCSQSPRISLAARGASQDDDTVASPHVVHQLRGVSGKIPGLADGNGVPPSIDLVTQPVTDIQITVDRG